MSSPNDGPPSGGTATDPTGPRADGNGSDGAGSDGAAAPDKPAGRRGLKRSTRVALLIILVIALLAGGVFAASYFLDARNYVTTDNAQVDGDKIAVNAPSSGTLIDWRANQGAELTADQVVGRIKVNGGFVQPQQSIRAPADATVAVDNGVEGAFVTAGTQLALAYDFSKVYVTARVDETDIDAVTIGQRVDFTVDAYPGNEFHGVVREIQGGAAGVFSLFPQSNSSGTFQKVTQVIPVKVSIDDLQGLNLVPGMNVTVKIHKNNN
ncbi:efflux RND transporter periplasmic adaptor subunit [Pseudonocardia charpentierae]|uniref:Efflux RND transporter periplasmic adaptor subunit n=1 Tax=Pseudonocardia charpentierae TaxID=3075545 RepID=A0ABU2N962_9PSEU|nr:efflux RND transporter periplasmic adaptor subunit [Pseudonocardia sp. DSM 45834]MDT0350419.1 efflux RND transporter periplasmic adaptor subunit [Pseudonocardia sp. DSM 45834]